MVQVMSEEGVIFPLTNYESNAIVFLKNDIKNIWMVDFRRLEPIKGRRCR